LDFWVLVIIWDSVLGIWNVFLRALCDLRGEFFRVGANMQTQEDLKRILARIDGRGYKAYKDVEGSYDFGDF